MVTFVDESNRVSVPMWVTDLASFRCWADTDDFPEKDQICYLKGEVWVDLTREPIFTHLGAKGEIVAVLGRLVKDGEQGLLLGWGTRFTNLPADVSCKPDAMFLSTSALRSGQVRLVDGQDGPNEIEGSPDMVLEVVSASSVNKDTVVLRRAYWEAGVREYWLIDARGEALTFDILRPTARGYVTTRKKDGWLKSSVFGKSFRLTRSTNPLGHPEYALAIA